MPSSVQPSAASTKINSGEPVSHRQIQTRPSAGLVCETYSESAEKVVNPIGGLVASSDDARCPSSTFHSCVKWSVPPTASHFPSGLAATEYAGHRPVGATSSPLSVSH